MDISLADVMIHIDETLSGERRTEIEDRLRAIDGVVSVANHADKAHLTIVEYQPDKVNSKVLVAMARRDGVHAELVGL